MHLTILIRNNGAMKITVLSNTTDDVLMSVFQQWCSPTPSFLKHSTREAAKSVLRKLLPYRLRIMDLRVEMQRVFYRTAQIGNFVLLLLWHILHFMIRIWYFARGIADMLESYLISSGLLKGYNTLNLDNLQNLAIVVDSEEAHQPSKVAELLLWLASLGVKNVYLYDIEGVLKKSKEAILERLVVAILSDKVTLRNYPLLDRKPNLEFVSYSDGKEAVAKAASLLFQKHYLGREEKEPPIFTESHVSEALSAVGSGGPDLDLLLVYGPARCHLGFPPWQIRYTEIIHMGPLKSMKYGSLIKAMRKFSMENDELHLGDQKNRLWGNVQHLADVVLL
ncbi:hypothetical protein HYC85_009582 [Camellia sinensis]|uniref:ditrans,polycis-polyprenyl diphosphate synthase [(2E,6E)-farnesyldiphosphate specific] n=1 Tax=Camellia sinensis TaxID=4442 RepID=A0A7J7HI25_CAMSI|nr:hypothetical protein HYC85_009582 [Camellia sinensis]